MKVLKKGSERCFPKHVLESKIAQNLCMKEKKMNKNKKILHVVPYLKDFFLGSIVV